MPWMIFSGKRPVKKPKKVAKRVKAALAQEPRLKKLLDDDKILIKFIKGSTPTFMVNSLQGVDADVIIGAQDISVGQLIAATLRNHSICTKVLIIKAEPRDPSLEP